MTAEIQVKLKNLTGPDPEVDLYVNAWVCQNVLGWQEKRIGADYDGANDCVVLSPPNLDGYQYPPKGQVHPWLHVPRDPITRDVDAVLGLMKKFGPLNFHGYLKDHQKITARVGHVDRHGNKVLVVEAVHKSSPAIAMLMATLKFHDRRAEIMAEREKAHDPA